MTEHNGRVTATMDIHVVEDWRACRAEATLDRGQRDDIQAAGAASVRYSPEHERYLVNLSWGDFWFFPTWDLAFARFLAQVAARVMELGREYHDASRVKVTEDAAEPRTRRR